MGAAGLGTKVETEFSGRHTTDLAAVASDALPHREAVVSFDGVNIPLASFVSREVISARPDVAGR